MRGMFTAGVLDVLMEHGLTTDGTIGVSAGAVFGCKGTHVERSIRSAIDTAWKQRDDRVWQRYFRVGSDGVIPRPSNAAFISRLAAALRLNQDAGNNEE